VNAIAEWVRRLQYLFSRARHDEALRAEIDAHRELMAEPRQFGSPLRMREDAADVWGWRWLDDLRQDLRYAGRSLAAHKAFTVTAVLTLALGIGATTAIFSLVSGLVLRPLPFAEPERLVQMHGSSALSPTNDAVNFLDTYRRESSAFEVLVGYDIGARYLRRGDSAERVMSVRGEPDFFQMLGTPASLGRTFVPGDPPTAIVISDAFWRREFGGRPDVLGSTLVFDEQTMTVVGVMPPSFQFPYRAGSLLPGVATEMRTDVWLPFEQPLRPQGRIGNVTGRLKPGVSRETAESQLKAVATRLASEFPQSNAGRTVYLESLADTVVSPQLRRVLFLLFGAVGLLLALACANVANLWLARLSIRGREVAVRMALGAGRGRLIRQLLTESLLLSLIGGAVGLALAWWGTAEIARLAAPYLPRAHELSVDWRVFAFLASVCTLVGLALGAVPAMTSSRGDGASTATALQQMSSRGTMTRGQRRLRDGLVVGEVAIACLLAVGAAMLVRELVRLRNTDSGMATTNVLTLHLGHRMTPQTDVMQFYEIDRRVSELPGVRAAGFIQMLPLQSWGWTSNSSDFVVRGRPPMTPVFPIQLRYVTPGYFQALGIPMTRGRDFTEGDVRDSQRVILINETLARRYFGDEDPVGLATTRGTIAGVVRDIRQEHLDRPALPELYYPVAQGWSQVSELGMTLVVSTRDRAETHLEPIRSIVRAVNPHLAVFDVKTMDRVVSDSLSDFTLYLSLMAGFAGLALVLALTGTYGVIAYIASARTKEFAVRAALGADAARVIRLVLGQGLLLTGLGLAVGLAAAVLASPLVADLPITVRPPDVATAAPVAVFIALVAVAACLIPAVRASRINPMAALREE
jgi:predicted permease